MADDERASLLERSAGGAAHEDEHDVVASLEPRRRRWLRWQKSSQAYLESRQKHYVVLALVTVDVGGILLEILVSLVLCDMGSSESQPGWVNPLLDVAKAAGLVISSLFMFELAATVWAFGWSYFSASWFHCLDAFVILISFVVDVLAKGIVEEVASLVVVLRLWRMAKIVEELSVGASEQMEELEAQVEKLEQEKEDLLREKDDLARRLQHLLHAQALAGGLASSKSDAAS